MLTSALPRSLHHSCTPSCAIQTIKTSRSPVRKKLSQMSLSQETSIICSNTVIVVQELKMLKSQQVWTESYLHMSHPISRKLSHQVRKTLLPPLSTRWSKISSTLTSVWTCGTSSDYSTRERMSEHLVSPCLRARLPIL